MVSVVIPTRNRLNSLNRVLASLVKQTTLPKEIIVVDSSDQLIKEAALISIPKSIHLKILHSKPSVCIQRNMGIQKAEQPYIFLSDDDLVYEQNYIEHLSRFLSKNPECSAVSGLIYEELNDKWSLNFPISMIKYMYFRFFGLSIFTDLSQKKASHRFYKWMINRDLKKGNRISKAGWPIFIDWSSDEIEFPFFSLMGAMIRKPNDRMFDPVFRYNGIGENYDTCIKLGFKIIVTKSTSAKHYKDPSNRIKDSKNFYYKTAALHYILKKHSMFNWTNRLYYIWSLIGLLLMSVVKRDLKRCKYCLYLLGAAITNNSIYA